MLFKAFLLGAGVKHDILVHKSMMCPSISWLVLCHELGLKVTVVRESTGPSGSSHDFSEVPHQSSVIHEVPVHQSIQGGTLTAM